MWRECGYESHWAGYGGRVDVAVGDCVWRQQSVSSDKAKSQACDAISDMKTQITTLKGLPLATSSVDTAKTALQAIQTDLKTISDAAPTVGGDVKSQLQTANATFKTWCSKHAERDVRILADGRSDGHLHRRNDSGNELPSRVFEYQVLAG